MINQENKSPDVEWSWPFSQ